MNQLVTGESPIQIHVTMLAVWITLLLRNGILIEGKGVKSDQPTTDFKVNVTIFAMRYLNESKKLRDLKLFWRPTLMATWTTV